MEDYLKRARSFYGKVDAATKVVLLKIFGDGILPVAERVRTLDDAMEVLGSTHPLVRARDILLSHESEVLEHGIVETELRIICTALNGGQYLSQEEDGYYPVFDLHFQVNPDCLYYRMTRPGQLFIYAGTRHTCNHVESPFRLKTEELAEYAGKQFIDYWKRYYIETDISSDNDRTVWDNT